MTFVLDAISTTTMGGFVRIGDAVCSINILNKYTGTLRFHRYCIDGRHDTFGGIALAPNDTLAVNIDIAAYNWKVGDQIRWWLDYMESDPVLFIERL